jgi:hypothetical protein
MILYRATDRPLPILGLPPPGTDETAAWAFARSPYLLALWPLVGRRWPGLGPRLAVARLRTIIGRPWRTASRCWPVLTPPTWPSARPAGARCGSGGAGSAGRRRGSIGTARAWVLCGETEDVRMVK